MEGRDDQQHDIFGLPLYRPIRDEEKAEACKLAALPASDPKLSSLDHANEVLHQCLKLHASPVTDEILRRITILLSQRTGDLCLEDTLELGRLCSSRPSTGDANNVWLRFKAAWQLRSRRSFLIWEKLEQTKNECARSLETQSKGQAALKEAEEKYSAQHGQTAEGDKAYEKAARKWKALTNDVQETLEKTRRVQQALGVIPSRQKDRLEDAKDRYAKGKAVFTAALDKMNRSQRSLAKAKRRVESATAKKQQANAEAHRCRERTVQVRQLVSQALQAQANETERVRLKYAREKQEKEQATAARRRQQDRKKKKKRKDMSRRRSEDDDDEDEEGLVQVTVVHGLEQSVQSLQNDLKGSAAVIEQLNSVAESAKKQLGHKEKELDQLKAERDACRAEALSLREELLKAKEESGDQRSSLEHAIQTVTEIKEQHRAKETEYSSALSELNTQISKERQEKDSAVQLAESARTEQGVWQRQLAELNKEHAAVLERFDALKKDNEEKVGTIAELHQNMSSTAQQLVQHAQDLQAVRKEMDQARAENNTLGSELEEMRSAYEQLASSKGETDKIYTSAMRTQTSEYEASLAELQSSLETVRVEYETRLDEQKLQYSAALARYEKINAELKQQLIASTSEFEALGEQLDQQQLEQASSDTKHAQEIVALKQQLVAYESVHKTVYEAAHKAGEDGETVDPRPGTVRSAVGNDVNDGHADDGHADDGHADDGHANDGHADDSVTAFVEFERINTEIAVLLDAEEKRKQLFPIKEEEEESESLEAAGSDTEKENGQD